MWHRHPGCRRRRCGRSRHRRRSWSWRDSRRRRRRRTADPPATAGRRRRPARCRRPRRFTGAAGEHHFDVGTGLGGRGRCGHHRAADCHRRSYQADDPAGREPMCRHCCCSISQSPGRQPGRAIRSAWHTQITANSHDGPWVASTGGHHGHARLTSRWIRVRTGAGRAAAPGRCSRGSDPVPSFRRDPCRRGPCRRDPSCRDHHHRASSGTGPRSTRTHLAGVIAAMPAVAPARPRKTPAKKTIPTMTMKRRCRPRRAPGRNRLGR